MVVSIILLVLLGLTQPLLTQQIHNHRLLTSLQSLYQSMQRARILAITQSTFVTVCPSKEGHFCDDSPDWHDGWIVFLDPLRVGQPSSQEALVEIRESVDKLVLSSGRRVRTRFSPEGTAYGHNLTIIACSRETEPLPRLVLSNAGRIRWEPVSSTEKCTKF